MPCKGRRRVHNENFDQRLISLLECHENQCLSPKDINNIIKTHLGSDFAIPSKS